MYGEQPVSASVLSQGKNKYTITFDGSQYEVTGKLAPRLDTNHIELVCDIQGDISKQLVLVNREGVTLYTRDGSYEFALPVPKFLSAIVSLLINFLLQECFKMALNQERIAT